MFSNITLSVVLFFIVSIFAVVSVIFMIGEHDWRIVFGVTALLGSFMAYLMHQLVIEPLKNHFETLERFSKETLHELNLPINTITANVQMLQRSIDDAKVQKRLARIVHAAEMLKERYNELDYLIKRQIKKESKETFMLDVLLKERLDLLGSLYGSFTFHTQLEPCKIFCDRIGFSKTIDNLIENSVKYSQEKRRIDITLREGVLLIRDYGEGMDALELIRMFDRYYQNDATMPGYGIGLALVKSFCDRNKIALHVKSEKGEGVRIYLDCKEVRC